jgi:hypothetical protein
MKASSLCFQAAIVFVIAGMIWGIVMAATQDHSEMPAHAHLNLLGWVSLFLIGIYYRLHPALENAGSALVQVWAWIAGTVILTTGVGLIYAGHPGTGEPIATLGSFMLVADMVLFGWLVYHRERADRNVRLGAAPAAAAAAE